MKHVHDGFVDISDLREANAIITNRLDVNADSCNLLVSGKMFTDEAVLLTCAQLNSKGIRSHVAEQDDHVRIELQLPSLTEEEKKAIVSEFMSDLVLNQVRVATNEQFKGIRDTLYQAAFLPVMKR